MKTKFYCYVDESGQDTRGKLFIVGIVIVQDKEREALEQVSLQLERRSGKGARKWTRTNHERAFRFTEQVLEESAFWGKLFVGIYSNEINYVYATVDAISTAVQRLALEECEVIIYMDGLPRELERTIGAQLRQSGVPVKKVRGANDQNEVLVRLADTICGFVREAKEGKKDWALLLNWAKQSGALRELHEK